MTDSHLRDLERRFLATRSPAAELAWLRERVRAGQRLAWSAYARLADLDPPLAATYLTSQHELGLLDGTRFGLAAFCGHPPARRAGGWARPDGDDELGVAALNLWVGGHERDPLAFELVLALVEDLVERLPGESATAARHREALLEALADCSPESSWSARTQTRVEREVYRVRSSSSPPEDWRATLRAVALLGNHRVEPGRLERTVDAIEEATAQRDAVGRWQRVVAETLLGPPLTPPPPTREVATADGFARFACVRSRSHVSDRREASKPFRYTSDEGYLHSDLHRFHSGQFFGAMQALFGRPHDILYDDWKESIAYFLDVDVDPAKRGRPELSPVQLLMRVSDLKGGLYLELYMPRRGDTDERLEDGLDVLPPPLRVEVLTFFAEYVRAFGETAHVPDFERVYPYGECEGKRFGVRGGVPFDEARDGD